MRLETTTNEYSLQQGMLSLTSTYSAGDGGPGSLNLEIMGFETGLDVRGTIRLDPWRSNYFPAYDWESANGLVVCGAERWLTLDVRTLRIAAGANFEYEEGETLSEPWLCESPAGDVLILATDRRIFCLDSRLAIRWVWSARVHETDRWINGPPRVEQTLVVPASMRRADVIVTLSLEDGAEIH
jgi:hypothetical protein